MKQENKEQQLGMTRGKARYRLVENLLFHLAKKCDMDICYQCGKKIQTLRELSIEHKIPWLDSYNPVELYFDMNNIAFSHLGCNSGAARATSQRKRIGKSGYKGVRLEHGKYAAIVNYQKKKHYAGHFNTPKEAAIAYDKKALEIQGANAITNKMLGLL